jgi:MoaA/NifB/PqqE/SkfB family radical SAM enzyme
MPQILRFKEVVRILDNICDSFGTVKSITYTSAEPLLNSEISQIVKYTKDKTSATRVSLITNGSKLNHKISEEFIKAGLDELKISINGLSDEEYLKNVGFHIDFDNFLENIRFLSSLIANNGNRMRLILKIIDYMVDTEEKLNKFNELFGDLGMIRVEHIIQADKRIDFTDFAKDSINNHQSVSGLIVEGKRITCPLAYYQLRICEDGSCKPCCNAFSPAPILGNAFTTSLVEIWNQSLKLQRSMLDGYLNVSGCKTCLAILSSVVTDRDELDPYINDIRNKYNKFDFS